MDDVFESKVETLAFGGKGIVRQNGMVVFIPFAIPDDLIRYRIVEKKSSYATGELLEIIEPSQDRIQPRCPYFGVCGGCQLQNLNYEKQLEHKKEALRDSLRRIGHVTIDKLAVVPANEQWEYRRHVHLTLKPSTVGFEMGYISTDNQSLVAIRTCPIFTVEEALFQTLAEMCKKFHADSKNEGRLTLLKESENQFIIHFHFKFRPENIVEVIEKNLTDFKECAGMILTTPKETLKWNKTTTQTVVDNLTVEYSTQVFMQNHPEQSQKIYREMIRIAAESNAKTILDLYCGIGVTTLMLAKEGIQVTGIENNRESIKFAKKNGNSNGIRNAKFILGNVVDVIEEHLEKKPDLVIVNPPREGLHKKVVEALCKHKPKGLIYVSCMPPTLARDLGLLTAAGYQLSSCEVYDMFPQTAHLETLSYLTLTK